MDPRETNAGSAPGKDNASERGTALSSQRARLALALAVMVACIGCDQGTKHAAGRLLRGSAGRCYLGGTLRLEYARNPGAFLSLGSSLPERARFWIFVVINGAMVLGVTWFLARHWKMRLAPFCGLLFFTAGAIGNWIDRFAQAGLVVDFLNLGVGPLRTGIFNVADMALVFGGVAFALTYQSGPEAKERRSDRRDYRGD